MTRPYSTFKILYSRYFPKKLGLFAMLAVLVLMIFPEPASAAGVTLTVTPSGRVSPGSQELVISTTVTGIRSDMCAGFKVGIWNSFEFKPQVHIVKSTGASFPNLPDGATYLANAGGIIGVYDIDTSGSVTQQFTGRSTETFGANTVVNFRAYVTCLKISVTAVTSGSVRGILATSGVVRVYTDGTPVPPLEQAKAEKTSTLDSIGGALISIVNIVLGVITALVRWIVYGLGLIFVGLLETALSIKAADISDFIFIAWTAVRDLVNMLFIIVLIIIGFGTMLRIESYNYKKLLVNLIIMAMLVNFSLVIGRIIIQLADVAQFTFLPAEGADGIEGVRDVYKNLLSTHITNILDGFRAMRDTTADASSATFTLIFQLIFELAVVLTFGALAIFMLIRTVALWILLILSPFAYALAILPTTAGIARQWWQNFIKYVLFAPIIAFFLRLTYTIYRDALKIFPSSSIFSSTSQMDFLDYLAQSGSGDPTRDFFTMAIIFIIVLAFLWAGMIITRQMGIFGAGAIVGLAERGLKAPLALGWKGAGLAVGFGTRKLGKKLGVQLSPHEWVESYKKYRKKKIDEDIQETAEKARGRAAAGKMFTSFGSPEDFFRKALSTGEIKRFAKNLKKGRFNINKWSRDEWGNVGEERKKADGMVSESDIQKGIEQKGQIEGENSLIDRGLGGSLNMENRRVNDVVQSVLARMKEEAQEALEAGDEEMSNQIKGEIAKINQQLKRGDKTNITYDLGGKVGEEIKNSLEGVKKDNVQKIGNIDEWIEKSKDTKVTDKEKEDALAAVMRREHELEQSRPPLSFEARLARSALVSEEKKHLAGINSAEELQAYLNDAIRQDNRYRVMAVMEKMAEDYNDNEAFNLTHRPKDPSRTYESNWKGANEFQKEIFQDHLGMDEQSSLEFMNKLSYINEDRSHWETARLVGVRGGRQYYYSEPEHATAALAELAKKGPRELLRQLNRLGYGGELQDASGKRTFTPSMLGISILKGLGPSLLSSNQFGHMNPNAIGKLSEERVLEIFRKSGVEEGILQAIKKHAGGQGGWNPNEVVGLVEDMMKRQGYR
ncbi:MAG: hypothetical protein Q8R08_04595 [bacterium]|nr:hypothetical protein [bacterium]